jgi:hypothetical protein
MPSFTLSLHVFYSLLLLIPFSTSLFSLSLSLTVTTFFLSFTFSIFSSLKYFFVSYSINVYNFLYFPSYNHNCSPAFLSIFLSLFNRFSGILMFFITSSVLLTLVFICLSVRIEKQKVWHQQQNRLSESCPTKIL